MFTTMWLCCWMAIYNIRISKGEKNLLAREDDSWRRLDFYERHFHDEWKLSARQLPVCYETWSFRMKRYFTLYCDRYARFTEAKSFGPPDFFSVFYYNVIQWSSRTFGRNPITPSPTPSTGRLLSSRLSNDIGSIAVHIIYVLVDLRTRGFNPFFFTRQEQSDLVFTIVTQVIFVSGHSYWIIFYCCEWPFRRAYETIVIFLLDAGEWI